MSEFNAQPTSHIFISQRLRLHYLDWGNEQAPPLLLLHGGRDHAHSWDWVARELQRDWHVIAPDLRGHGDSVWSPDGAYFMPYFIYDLAQLIHQQGLEKVSIVAHSYGGNLATRYTGMYPENVRRLVVIEGLGAPPSLAAKMARKTVDERFRDWIDEQRGFSTRPSRRYKTIEEALERMRVENTHLSEEQARHLTVHGVSRNEDGSYSWKFDNYVRAMPPQDISAEERHRLWDNITCPVLLLHGANSWAVNPAESGDVDRFRNAKAVSFENAGHWPHHDQFDLFMREIRAFL
jgi:pimeloyl-ACP methyl ester carboxylesterase